MAIAAACVGEMGTRYESSGDSSSIVIMWKGQRACDSICIGELEQTRHLFAWHST